MEIACFLVFAMACSPLVMAADSAADSTSPDFVYVCRDAGAGGYQAFPDVCRLQDGRLMAIFYAGYGHIALPCPQLPKGGRISYCISTDEGHTWSKAETLFDGPDDDRDPSMVQLKDGRLLCNFFSLHRKTDASQPTSGVFTEPFTPAGTWLIESGDLGKTWSEARKIYDETWYCSSPIRVLSDGRLILGLYRENPSAGAIGISDDNGKTWQSPIAIDNAGQPLDAETDVIELKDGRLWAAERSSRAPMCFATSADRGNTWSKSEPVDFVGHCPYLLRAEHDIILLGYRAYTSTGTGFTGLRYSLDECKTWSKPITVDNFLGAYPSMVNLKDGSVLIVYYEESDHSSIRAKRFKVTPEGVTWLAP
jgi:Neuraminidase (sialidase)